MSLRNLTTRSVLCIGLMLFATVSHAKLPPPSEAERSQKAEADARTKVQLAQEQKALTRAQDRVAEQYRRQQITESAKTPKTSKVSKASKAPKAAKAPPREKLSCRTGPNDHQARLIVDVVKGRPMEFAYYSRLGVGVCSIHGQRGDAYTKWGDQGGGKTAVRLLTGSAHLEYKPGMMKIKFSQVDRMQYCGMYGVLNGSVVVSKGKSECRLDGVFK